MPATGRLFLSSRVIILSMLITVVLVTEGTPRGRRIQRSHGGGSGGAYSAASYASLGIEPSARSFSKPAERGTHSSPPLANRNERQQYWWQGPNSPFSLGAANDKGISGAASPSAVQGDAGSNRAAVIGCSGTGCGTFDPPSPPGTRQTIVGSANGEQQQQQQQSFDSSGSSSNPSLYWQ
jgi:hypothetical protein